METGLKNVKIAKSAAKKEKNAKNPLLVSLLNRVNECDRAHFELMVSDRFQSPVLNILVSEHRRERCPRKGFDCFVQRVIGVDGGLDKICKDRVGSFLIEAVIEAWLFNKQLFVSESNFWGSIAIFYFLKCV